MEEVTGVHVHKVKGVTLVSAGIQMKEWFWEVTNGHSEKGKERLMTSLIFVLKYLKVDGCKGIIFEKECKVLHFGLVEFEVMAGHPLGGWL